MANKNNNQNVRCSFCGKAQEMVKRIVAGPNAYICDECINVCTNIMEDEHYEENLGYEDVKSEDIPTPAEIVQPRNVPDWSITNILLAVPRTITRQGRGYLSIAATAPTIMSAPS